MRGVSPLGRRSLLQLAATSFVACRHEAPPVTMDRPSPPDLVIERLTSLLTVAGLGWLLLLSPSALWSVSWLRPSLGRILEDERLDLLARATGIDLRQAPELALASYQQGDTIAYLVRHRQDPLTVERRFRARLTSDETRSVHGHQLVTMRGKVGTAPRGFASLGRDVAVFQYDGEPRRGPLAVAVLYAQGKLADIPSVLDDPVLAAIHRALGDQAVDAAPLELLWPGPFEDHLARGARGLLAASTGFGLAARPAEPGVLSIQLIIAGDFEGDGERATAFLDQAWNDLASADLGHLLGLHRPRQAPKTFLTPLGLVLEVELDAALLIDGLAAATVDDVREIMKTPPEPPETPPSEP